MRFSQPKIEVGSVIITFQETMPGITSKKLYIVEGRPGEGYIVIRNDDDKLVEVRSIYFIEADVAYTILLSMTFDRLFNLKKH